MKILSIPAIAFVCAGLVGAAETPSEKPVPSSTQAEQEGAPVGSPVQTSGKVTSMHSLDLAGVSDPHMLVKLQNEQGDIDIVDLGPTSVLKTSGIEPKEGQQFWVDGQVGKINDKFLIVAERLSQSPLILIPRSAPLREETTKHAEARKDTPATQAVSSDKNAPKTETIDAGQQVRTVEGTVLHSKHMMIEGDANEHVLAKLQTEHGIAVIDLGTCQAMPNAIDLTVGKRLAATGYVGQLNGRPIILAESVGNLNNLQRPTESIPTSAAPATK